MPVFGQLSQGQLVTNAQARLQALRDALVNAQQFYLWLSAYAASDLETAPLNLAAADATALLTAFADANALADIYETGLPPGTYPQPASAYVYAASMRAVIGPQG